MNHSKVASTSSPGNEICFEFDDIVGTKVEKQVGSKVGGRFSTTAKKKKKKKRRLIRPGLVTEVRQNMNFGWQQGKICI
jgi:hypothetical protein